MDIPRIVSLDLRPPRERQHIAWDWPYPARVYSAEVTIAEGLVSLRRKPIRQWYWHRISFALGTLLLAVQAAWLLAEAWL